MTRNDLLIVKPKERERKKTYSALRALLMNSKKFNCNYTLKVGPPLVCSAALLSLSWFDRPGPRQSIHPVRLSSYNITFPEYARLQVGFCARRSGCLFCAVAYAIPLPRLLECQMCHCALPRNYVCASFARYGAGRPRRAVCSVYYGTRPPRMLGCDYCRCSSALSLGVAIVGRRLRSCRCMPEYAPTMSRLPRLWL